MGRKKTNYIYNNVPTSWNDISLKKFLDIEKAYEESEGKPNSIKVLAAITNEDEKALNEAPAIIADKLYQAISFINEPLNIESNNEIEINGEKYSINYENELKFGEYVDVQTVMEDNNKSYAVFLAILCRKEGEIYDDNFKQKILPSRVEMFNNAPITKIYPVISFFLQKCLESPSIMNKYSDLLIDQGKHILNRLENYLENGGGSKRSMRLRKKTLQTLRNALNSI